MDSEKKIYQIPEFAGENIPLKEAARIMGKDMHESLDFSGLAEAIEEATKAGKF